MNILIASGLGNLLNILNSGSEKSCLNLSGLTHSLTHSHTHSMQHSPSEANRFSASQEITHISRNSKVRYCTRKCPKSVPILSHLDPAHADTFNLLMIHLNIIFPSMPRSPKLPLSLKCPHQNPVYASPVPHTFYMSRPSHSSLFDHTNNIRWAVHVINL